MCWYSVEHSGRKISKAEVGQRLSIRKMHWGETRWAVAEHEPQGQEPAPVCMIEFTQVVFRPTETEQAALHLGPEPQAFFLMLHRPKRDVFEFDDGRQIEMNQLPDGLVFDVLVVPGKEHLSALVTAESLPESDPDRENLPVDLSYV